ncbi:Na(+)/H(+) antiporter subunit D [BD1-7 clade bacterium]|uniref:Na(+)/H(+) antiporter subunit D n=1 Tax=BD1-7 clade bacterium TaxID=2029982 RepID=A0A5S9NNN9_9GAMM|nr:Na(+)/H(+) antiporter subunit D [BD1-7 clade bacterium]
MNNILLVFPVFVPLLTACLVAFCFRSRSAATVVSWIGAMATLLSGVLLLATVIEQGIQVKAFSGWKAPFGIVFVADLLSAAMVIITGIIAVAVVFYSTADLARKRSYALYHILMHVLIAGVMGSFLTGDIFNLYVWFEVMLIASFGLMVVDAGRKQIDSAVKYVVLNLVSTMVFLLAIGLLYGATGTLNMADLHEKVPLMNHTVMIVVAGLFLFGFAIKSALFPVFSWLPASYHNLPSAVVALYAALLTKVGIYAMIRVFTLVFSLPETGFQPFLIVIAGLTMLTGVLGAASQFSVKRILSFHIVSQIGYMLMGFAIFTPLAITGAVFYIIHHIIVKANLFLMGGYLERRFGTDDLAKLGGVYRLMPGFSLLFLVPAFSLAGFPPLSGFWGKFLVIKASLLSEEFMLAGVALFVSLLTIYSMTKIWGEAFWKPLPEGSQIEPIQRSEQLLYLVPIISLASLTVLIGLFVEPIYQLASTASYTLLNPDIYVNAVLGARQ